MIKPTLTIEEEDGLPFTVIRVNLTSDEPYIPLDFVQPGLCKLIITEKNMSRTYYFYNMIESSKEKILQDVRIKSLRR